MKTKILVVEDAIEYQMMLKATLGQDHELVFVDRGETALSQLMNEQFDLVIIDVVLPDMSGLQICTYIKSQERLSAVPVVLLTSKDTIEDKIQGFEFGADDYVTKPFNSRELQARIKNKLRQGKKQTGVFNISDLEIDQDKQRVSSIIGKKVIDLTRIEYKMLMCFVQRIDLVLSRGQILDLVWPNELSISERTVDSHVSNIRRKISGSGVEISAVQGSGYRFTISKKTALSA
jgi:DNA-binding response OmpR family regulator